ncbi:MAG: adenosylcobinamide-phosphate synthase CbiB [Caldimicrobium sp.]
MILKFFTVKEYQIFCAMLMDLLIGDPKRIPHPVSGIGYLIQFYENKFRRLPINSEKIKGVFFFWATCGTTLFLSLLLSYLMQKFSAHSILGEILFIFLISQFLALRGLIEAGERVENYLREDNLKRAREALIALVGRDTDKLHKREMQKAILESFAENLNDAVIAPLFWLALLGLPGLVLYKTINTLDSMVGYKNEKYFHFGWFSAKIDDIFNFIPSRITALLIALATTMYLGVGNGKRSLEWMTKYAPLHPSPNSGYPEAALAGALGVKLLGPAYYQGILIEKPYLGEDLISNLSAAISVSKRLLYFSSFIWIIILIAFLRVSL